MQPSTEQWPRGSGRQPSMSACSRSRALINTNSRRRRLVHFVKPSAQQRDDGAICCRVLINEQLDAAHRVGLGAVMSGSLHGMAQCINSILCSELVAVTAQ